jgi:hypothetical protein
MLIQDHQVNSRYIRWSTITQFKVSLPKTVVCYAAIKSIIMEGSATASIGPRTNTSWVQVYYSCYVSKWVHVMVVKKFHGHGSFIAVRSLCPNRRYINAIVFCTQFGAVKQLCHSHRLQNQLLFAIKKHTKDWSSSSVTVISCVQIAVFPFTIIYSPCYCSSSNG